MNHTQHTRPPCPSSTPRVHTNPCPLSHWHHPIISFSVIPFSSCPQSFPVSGSFPMSQVFTSGGQSTGASSSASVLPMNIQDWFPLGLTGLIYLQSKGLSRVFSNNQFENISSSVLSLLHDPTLIEFQKKRGERKLTFEWNKFPRSEDLIFQIKPYHQIKNFLVAQLVKNWPAMKEDLGLIPRSGRSPGEGNGNPLQYSCLESQMWLSD